MSGTLWAIVLTLSGGVAELVGLGLVAWEIRQDRAQARRLFHGDVVVKVGGATATARAGGVAVLTGGPEPTVEERVDKLEEEVRRQREAFDQRVAEVRAELSREVSAQVADARAAAAEDSQKVWRAIQAMLEGGLGRRALGVGLFAVGLILSVAGNVVGAAAT